MKPNVEFGLFILFIAGLLLFYAGYILGKWAESNKDARKTRDEINDLINKL